MREGARDKKSVRESKRARGREWCTVRSGLCVERYR